MKFTISAVSEGVIGLHLINTNLPKYVLSCEQLLALKYDSRKLVWQPRANQPTKN